MIFWLTSSRHSTKLNIAYSYFISYNLMRKDPINKSVDYISKADILIIGGTSLAVYPAAGLIDYYRGNKLVLVNKSPTPADRRADLVIHAPIGEVFSQL